jgi:hypothetical protein
MTLRKKSPPRGRLAIGTLLLASAPALAQVPPATCQACAGPNAPQGLAAFNGGPFGRCPRVAPGAIPAPNGWFVHQWEAAQVSKAAQDFFVVYGNEWYLGGMELGPFGRHHLDRIARCLAATAYPVIIQPTLNNEVNETRRRIIIEYLANHGIGDAPARVVVAFPEAEGLYGEEAFRVYGRMFQGRAGGMGGTGTFGGAAPFGGVGGSLGINSLGSGGIR